MTINDDEGKVRLAVAAGGSEHEKELDLYEAHDTFVDLDARHRDDPAGHHAALGGYLQAAGFPPLSYRSCILARDAVYSRVRDLRGKGQPPEPSGTPDSPDSTASPSVA